MEQRRIIFLGGDRRERLVMQDFLRRGHAVAAWGWEAATLPDGVELTTELSAALAACHAIILPLPPLHEDGRLHSLSSQRLYLPDRALTQARPGTPLLAGLVTPHLSCMAQQCHLLAVLELEDIARPLAEATAEGALAEAIRLSPGLLYNEKALVIGYGRIGRALAWRLTALGMKVTVINRGDERAEQARRIGYAVPHWSQLTAAVAEADFIFNTAPALLLPRSRLQWLRPQALLLDLSAAPGGVDFEAAAELGVRAVLAGGLPGRFAPQLCGQVMAQVYQAQLEDLWERWEI